MNRLAGEKSPYLLQHANNPVDWHPWGAEAFARARAKDKPILLSIGYSTCHWCHVMERESFENADIAALMNARFVCVKVDREERPDVDRFYMTAVQAMTGSGGWPLTVFLTPELKPFFGGTYFPPAPRWGQPGFAQLLERVGELWKTRREALIADSAKLTAALREILAAKSEPGETGDWPAIFSRAYDSYRGAFDPEQAGFGGAPKFPMPVNLNFLLRHHARSGEKDALEMALATLKAMSRGGIYDQIGGGFHRYSTDAEWRVPHFEKMLYDNAQIAVSLVEAYQISRDEFFARKARHTLDYVLREMTHPDGGFYSAQDADSLNESGEKSEGAYYLWSAAELKRLLGADAERVMRFFGTREEGNAPVDPHGEFAGKNVLFESAENEDPIIERARKRLLEARAQRQRPGLDDKVLTSWNGLMISAFAKAAGALGEPRYLAAAESAARFLRERLYDEENQRLFRRWREGERAVAGIADDYAFLAQGLIDLYEASFDDCWLEWAETLASRLLELFSAPEGGFYMTEDGHDPHLPARMIDDADNVEPCANSVAALDLLRLADMTGGGGLRDAALRALQHFQAKAAERPLSLPQMLVAADFAAGPARQVVLTCERADDPQLLAMRRELTARFLPRTIVLFANREFILKRKKRLPFLETVKPLAGKAAAYVCSGFSCRQPTSDLKVLVEQLA